MLLRLSRIWLFGAAAFLSGISSLAAPADWVGRALPAASVTYLDEVPVFQDRAILLEFWATWCPYCRSAIPHLNDLSQQYRSQGLITVGVTQEPAATIEQFRSKMPVKFPIIIDPSAELTRTLGVSSIPLAFLVNKAGTIVWYGRPTDLSEALLREALK